MSYRPALLTTKGDLPGFSTVLTKVGVGSNTQVLTANSSATSGFDWEAAGGSGALALVGEDNTGSARSSLSVSAIASTWRHLCIVAKGFAASGTPNVILRFNADSGAHYDWIHSYINSTTSASEGGGNDTSIHAGFAQDASYPFAIEGVIYDYAGATYKILTLRDSAIKVNAGSTSYLGSRAGGWQSTAAITSITLTLDNAANFTSTSMLIVYGLGH
jgi:hypothetical protein